MNKVTTLNEALGKRCQETMSLDTGDPYVPLVVVCERLLAGMTGQKYEHVHHWRTYEVPGCEQARVSWTRRR
jgi:hypothetical protein